MRAGDLHRMLLRRLLLAVLALALLLALVVPDATSLPAPSARRTAGGLALSANPTTGPAPLLVEFDVTVPNGTPPTFAWSFGDGQYWNGSGPASLHPAHEYLRPGVYTASVMAEWSSGALRAAIPIHALGTNLTVALAANPLEGAAPLRVAFQADPYGGSGTYVSFLWEFGDGSPGGGPAVNHTYTRPGTYEVNLTVTDSAQRVARGSARVTVAPAPSGDHNSSGPGGSSPPGTGTSTGPSGPSVGPIVAGVAGVGAGALAVGAAWVAWQRRKRPKEAPHDTSGPAPDVGPPARTRFTQVAAGLSLRELRPGPIPLPSGAPGGRPTGPSGSAFVPPTLVASPDFVQARQLTQRLIRHLAGLPRLGPNDVPTQEWTQAGMASSLVVGLSAVSKILRRLEAAGIVTAETGHAIGSSRRVRIYRLTPRGERLGQALREAGPGWSERADRGRRTPGP